MLYPCQILCASNQRIDQTTYQMSPFTIWEYTLITTVSSPYAFPTLPSPQDSSPQKRPQKKKKKKMYGAIKWIFVIRI